MHKVSHMDFARTCYLLLYSCISLDIGQFLRHSIVEVKRSPERLRGACRRRRDDHCLAQIPRPRTPSHYALSDVPAHESPDVSRAGAGGISEATRCSSCRIKRRNNPATTILGTTARALNNQSNYSPPCLRLNIITTTRCRFETQLNSPRIYRDRCLDPEGQGAPGGE